MPEEQSNRTIAGGEAEKIRWAVDRFTTLVSNRKWLSSALKGIVETAASEGLEKKVIRGAFRFEKMTPEKREEWRRTTAASARLYGIEIAIAENDAPTDDPAWPHIEKFRFLNRQVRDAAAEMKEFRQICKENGIDEKKVRLIAPLIDIADGDPEAAENWFIQLDSYGSKLGLW